MIGNYQTMSICPKQIHINKIDSATNSSINKVFILSDTFVKIINLKIIQKELIIITKKNGNGIKKNKNDCKGKDVILKCIEKGELNDQVNYLDHRMDILTLTTSIERKERIDEVYQ